MLYVRHDGVHGPRVGDVAGKRPVVYRHVLAERVHHHLVGLLQRHPLLVVTPPDVGERAAVCRAAGGVYRAELVFPDPPRTELQQPGPVPLSYTLCQPGNIGRGKQARRRKLVHLLMTGQAGVREVCEVREHGKRHDVVHHVLVAVEHILQVFAQPRPLRNLLQEPGRTVEAVLVFLARRRTARPPVS